MPTKSESKLKTLSPLIETADLELKVVSFNALKLRIFDEALVADWAALAAEFATADVVVLQEVPAGSAQSRVDALCAQMEAASGELWISVMSEPSGPGNPEVHAALVRAPLEVHKIATLHRIDGASMDHAPLALLLRGHDALATCDLVVVSVHLPPRGRQRQREEQLRALLRGYETRSDVRLDMPLTDQGARDARAARSCAHIITGDFNCAVGADLYRSLVAGAYDVLLGNGAATSAGEHNYDNFVTSANLKSHFEVGSGVLRLSRPQKSSAGKKGVSDHHPIYVKLSPHKQR